MRGAADRAKRKLDELKATHTTAEVATRHVAKFEYLKLHRLTELLAQARPALAEAQTPEGKRAILDRVVQQLIGELDAAHADALAMPTLADLEKRKVN
ncbi:MAG: hypothetical protein AB7O63_13160 [Reyranellaceae bacterium]